MRRSPLVSLVEGHPSRRSRGNWADHGGPLALRPCLATGVPFLAGWLFTDSASTPEKTIFSASSNRYWIRSNTLKIGMYIATIMAPMIPPKNAIMSGSISEVSASVVASTSWS